MKINICIKTILLFLFIVPFCVGCSNDTDLVETPSVNNDYSGHPVMVTVGNVINARTEVLTRAAYSKEFFSQPLDKNKDTGFELETTIEHLAPMQTRAVIPLANAVFRLVAYKNGEVSPENYAGQGDFQTDSIGTTTPLTGHELFLPEGEYAFVCYSYGNLNAIPAFDGTVINVPVNNYEDFMTYTKKDVDVKANDEGVFTLQKVIFVKHCALVQVEVSAEGYPGDNKITRCAATLQNMNGPVNWSLGTDDSQKLPNSGTNGTVTVAWTNLNTDSVTSEEVNVMSVTKRNIALLFSDLQIGGLSFDNTLVNIPDKQFEPGGKYKITIKLKRNFIEIGGYKWAKGNLYKEGENFYIEASQEAYHSGMEGGSFFGWNTTDITPGKSNSGDYSYAADPCSKVAPENTWQTPNREACQALIQDGWEWDEINKGTWFGTGSNKLFLPAAGIRFDGAQQIELEGEITFYGLRDPFESTRCAYLHIESLNAIVTEGMTRTTGMPIRCVKKTVE